VRAAYLASHLTKLRPFIAPGVAEAIERTAASAPAGALQLPEPPSSPPEQLKAVLRDYQVGPSCVISIGIKRGQCWVYMWHLCQ
jgi:hypothetical protein